MGGGGGGDPGHKTIPITLAVGGRYAVLRVPKKKPEDGRPESPPSLTSPPPTSEQDGGISETAGAEEVCNTSRVGKCIKRKGFKLCFLCERNRAVLKKKPHVFYPTKFST